MLSMVALTGRIGSPATSDLSPINLNVAATMVNHLVNRKPLTPIQHPLLNVTAWGIIQVNSVGRSRFSGMGFRGAEVQILSSRPEISRGYGANP